MRGRLGKRIWHLFVQHLFVQDYACDSQIDKTNDIFSYAHHNSKFRLSENILGSYLKVTQSPILAILCVLLWVGSIATSKYDPNPLPEKTKFRIAMGITTVTCSCVLSIHLTEKDMEPLCSWRTSLFLEQRKLTPELASPEPLGSPVD